jgi:maleate isomerase
MSTSARPPEPARAGLIIPSSNRQVEQEMVRWFPPALQPHIARLRMTMAHHRPLREQLPRITEAAGTLDDARCEVVVFHCTGTAMEEGPAGEARIREALRAGTRAKVTTTAGAVDGALRSVWARRIVLFTPADGTTTETEAEFLRTQGFDIVATHALNLGGSDDFCRAPSSFWYETVVAARCETDAYFVSCANIACFDVIADLERTLDRPVVTSNQAVLWEALRLAGVDAPIPGLGRLLVRPAVPASR